MSKLKLIVTLMFMFAFSANSAEKLDFTKKKNFYLGEGEYGAISLELVKYETFNFQSDMKKPFILKKVNSTGLLELIFDSTTLSGSLEEGKTYSASFGFTKKDIGKVEKITVSAVYRPELRIIVKDSLLANNARISFSPDNKTATLQIKAAKNVSNLKINDPDGYISLGKGGTLSFSKGINELVVNLAKEENFEAEILLYKPAGEGNIDELYLLISSTGFKTVNVDAAVSDVTEADTLEAEEPISSDSSAAVLSGDINETGEADKPAGGFGLTAIIIISVMGVIILLLLFALLTNKKGALFEKYQTFFEDVATLVKIDPRGSNIDKTTEEIMMVLLEKFEFSTSQPEKPAAEIKKVLKKPANLKSPGISPKKDTGGTGGDEIQLDFGSSPQGDKKNPEPDAPLDPKPVSSGEKKISRGFDFLEDDN